MRRALGGFILLLSVAASMTAQTTATSSTAPVSSTPLPPLILSVREITQHGSPVYDCSSTNPECFVDILSTLSITPDLAKIPTPGGSTIGALDPVDSQKRAALNQALLSLNLSLELSRQLITLKAQGKTQADADANSASVEFAQSRLAMHSAIDSFFRLTPGNESKSKDDLPFVAGYPKLAETGQWLASQITDLDARSAARASAATSDLQVRMGAIRVHGANSIPIHLAGYDTFDSRSPTDIKRITFDVSSSAKAQNAAEVAATAQIANLIRTNFKQLTDAYKKEIADAKAQLQGVQKDLTAASTKSADLVVLLQGLAAKLQATTVSDPTLQANLKKAGTDVAALATTVQTTLNAVNAATAAISSLPSSLDNAAKGIDGSRPDLVLQNVLGVASGVQSSVTSALSALSDARGSLLQQLSAVEKDFQAIASSLPSDASSIVSRVRTDLLSALTGPILQLDATKAIMSALATSDPGPVQDASSLLDLNAPQILTVSQPAETMLEIARTDPSENDLIDIGISVLRQSQVIYEEHRSIRIHFYGWHSGLASGLIFVRSQKSELENLKPEAAAIWRIVRTPRPWETAWYQQLRPAIGFHSTTLHFGGTSSTTAGSGDTSGVQFGLGVSAHLWNDLLQVGYGWNIAVTKNRAYGYFGLGIMGVLRQVITGPGS